MPVLAALGLFLAAAPLLALFLLGAPGLAPLLADPAWHAAFLRTLNLAALATPLALLLGVAESLILRLFPRPARPFLSVLFSIPLLVPTALLLPRLQDWADQASPAAHEHALLAAHALPASVLAFLVLSRGLDRIDTILLASLRAAGASPATVIRLGILSELIPALLSAAAASFAAAIALAMADTVLAEAFHPTLGAMLRVSIQTADAQTAPAGLLLAALATAPLILPACVSLLRRR
jgi:putative spermidine/putrescine transport system permease protein